MKKKIVIITNYYPPEIGAAANRIKNLAEGLNKDGNSVSVICPLPNYPTGKVFKEYKSKFIVNEEINGIKIKRCWILPSNSKNVFVRLISMLSFAWSIWFSFFNLLKNKPSVFIIQSPPLLVSFSGLLLSRVVGAKRILNVSDIWPLSALELGVIKKGFFYNFFELIEKVNYRLAHKIVGQSEETIEHISKIVKKDFLVYRNVPKYQDNKIKLSKNNNLKIVYAGLLGYAQGVLNICENIDFKRLKTEFHIYGAGMEEDAIQEIANKESSNIYFHGVKTENEIGLEINKYDVGLVPLKNKIYGAVPSKIFELIRFGVPILFFGEGEGAKIVEAHNVGLSTNTNSIIDFEKMICEFGNMPFNSFQEMSSNAIKLHKEKFHLDKQLINFIKIL